MDLQTKQNILPAILPNILATILIIVGVTGDLSKRKLLPAIAAIKTAGILPEHFHVIGTSRKTLPESPEFESFMMDVEDSEDYLELKTRLEAIEKEWGTSAQKLFYLSVPADAASTLIKNFGESGISTMPDVKLLMEKPFGRDLLSAEKLVSEIKKYFIEDQVYRIDHYLAKEMAQNIVIFRTNNTLFKNTWNKEFIKSIEIIATESIGIEGRVDFYENTGALRDLVQSHLLQLAALTLMDATPPLPSPKGGALDTDVQNIPARRLQALQQIEIPKNISQDVIRGQYIGYRDEVKNAESMTETFVSMKLFSNDPSWAGVPITITTGKALDKKSTEIRITYKKDQQKEANMLTMRIQPDEGIEMCLWTKKPGYESEIEMRKLDFSYGDHDGELAEAYERVLVDAMKGDHSLFTTSEEVLASWKILEPIQKAWESDKDDLKMYAQGSKVENVLK